MIDVHTDTMLQAGLIEPAQCEWASNVVLIRKTDGGMRFCVDYRQLNERTVKDSYPLPRIDDCLDELADARWFSTFDLLSRYHQVELDLRDAGKTTFVARSGIFRFRVMPFGLCNAPATFQRLMNVALAGLDPMVCLVYLDDIIVHSPALEAHLERLTWLFERLRSTGLMLKVFKCRIMQREVALLGHRVSSEGLSTDPAKISAIQDWPVPCCLRYVRSFMGLCGYYRKFVADFSEIAAPLHALTKKNRRFQWDSDCQTAFETLKQRLVSSSVLRLPSDEGELVVDTDTFEHAVGAVLSQSQDGEERVIAYYSKLYSRSESNYCTSWKELMAVVAALKQFRPYIHGQRFRVRTDHAALRYCYRAQNLNGQQTRWLDLLDEYNFQIEYRAGSKHQNADALSRRSCRSCAFCSKTSAAECLRTCATEADLAPEMVLGSSVMDPWSPDALRQVQAVDSEVGEIVSWRTSSDVAPTWSVDIRCSDATKEYWNQWQLTDGVLYRRCVAGDGHPRWFQSIHPVAMRQELIRHAHTGYTGRHLGVRKTQNEVQRRGFWKG